MRQSAISHFGYIGIAGTGRVAQALGRYLIERGQPVMAIAGRDPERTAQAARFLNACTHAGEDSRSAWPIGGSAFCGTARSAEHDIGLQDARTWN